MGKVTEEINKVTGKWFPADCYVRDAGTVACSETDGCRHSLADGTDSAMDKPSWVGALCNMVDGVCDIHSFPFGYE